MHLFLLYSSNFKQNPETAQKRGCLSEINHSAFWAKHFPAKTQLIDLISDESNIFEDKSDIELKPPTTILDTTFVVEAVVLPAN